MKDLSILADKLVGESQDIADAISGHNPGLCKKKVPLENIQQSVSSTIRGFLMLYTDIGEKIRNDS